jgi:hypothetical protein
MEVLQTIQRKKGDGKKVLKWRRDERLSGSRIKDR